MIGIGIGIPYGSSTGIGGGLPPIVSRLSSLLDSLGGILWLPNQHNYTLSSDTTVTAQGDPVGYMGSHRQNLPENYVKNSMMVGTGGVNGSPDYWSYTTAVNNGITLSFVGSGIDSDGSYSEFSLSGTDAGGVTANPQINPNGVATSTDHPVAALGQLWSVQIKVKGVSGTQRQMTLRMREVDTGGTALGTDTTVNITPTNYTATSFNTSKVIVNSTVARLRCFLQFSVAAGSGTWNNVFRVYAPQLERGKPTAFTPTYGTVVTRGTNFEPAWQDTTANKPLLGVDANGKSILTFDGTDDFFRTGIQTPEAGYIAGVWQTSSTGSARDMLGSSNTATTIGAVLRKNASEQAVMQRNDGTLSASAAVGSFGSNKRVVDANYSFTDAFIRLDGANEGTTALDRTVTSTNYFRIGATGTAVVDGQTHFWLGTMSAKVFIPGERPGATVEAEIRRLLAEITTVSGVV